MATKTFVERTRKHGHETTVTVETFGSALGELRAERGRYWDYVGDHVTLAREVKVSFRNELGGEFHDSYVEIETPFGVGCLVKFRDTGYELMAFVPHTGPALVHGCWKKYGSYRGHAVSWLRGKGLNVNSRTKVQHHCPLALYRAAAGKES